MYWLENIFTVAYLKFAPLVKSKCQFTYAMDVT